MQHFPVFLAVAGAPILIAGGGETALAKLRLLMKTEARLTVFAADPAPEVERLAAEGRIAILRRAMQAGDAAGARLVYAATDDAGEDARIAGLARAEGVFVNIVDNLQDSDFLTPAIVDRDPVVIAIGTEGAAPVLARAIKAEMEERLAPRLGILARIGKAFRASAATARPGRNGRSPPCLTATLPPGPRPAMSISSVPARAIPSF